MLCRVAVSKHPPSVIFSLTSILPSVVPYGGWVQSFAGVFFPQCGSKSAKFLPPIIVIITIINDYCRENLYPRKFLIKEDFSNPRNIEPSKICTHAVPYGAKFLRRIIFAFFADCIEPRKLSSAKFYDTVLGYSGIRDPRKLFPQNFLRTPIRENCAPRKIGAIRNFLLMQCPLYRRTIFKCESLIIANCEFFPQSHLKERNK